MGVLDEVEQLKKSRQTPDESASGQLPQTEVEKPLEPAKTQGPTDVQGAMQQAISERLSEGSKDIKEITRDLTYMKGASDLQDDEKFKDQYQAEIGKQLIQDLKDEGARAAIMEAAKRQQARNIKSQSFYDSCRPIFKMLGIEEAYGVVPMIITVVLLMIPFLLVSLVRFVINAVNSLFVAISKFAKPAFWICTVLIILTITAAVVIAALGLIDTFFGTDIIFKARDVVTELVQ